MNDVWTTDMMYAALLMTFGAELEELVDCGRYTKLRLSVPESALLRAKEKAERLSRLFERCENIAELEVAFEQSLVHDTSLAYYRIKRRVAKERSK